MTDGLFYNSGNVEYNALRMGFAPMNEDEMKDYVELVIRELQPKPPQK